MDRNRPRRLFSDDRGGAPAFVAVVITGIALGLIMVLVPAKHRLTVADAQWAADAAALAGAAEFRQSGFDDLPGTIPGPMMSAIVAAAAANGAEVASAQVFNNVSSSLLDEPAPLGQTIIVNVELGGVGASAAASQFAVENSMIVDGFSTLSVEGNT